MRAEVGRGAALPDRLRDALERAYGADLEGVRLHDDETAGRVARSLGTDACTAGADVFVQTGALHLDSDAGIELIAHEVAHVVQQATIARRPMPHGAQAAEREAAAVARAFVRGRLTDHTSPRRRRARTLGDGDPLVLQCHSSWEHRMLGDFRTPDFDTIAAGGENRKAFLERVQHYLRMWETTPRAVGADRISEQFDYLHPLTLSGSGLVVTYGELNTLADYLATPAELDGMSEPEILPILQQVRQEGYAWVTWVIEDQWLNKEVVFGGFEGSVADTFGWDSADSLWETYKLDGFTGHWGPNGMNRYGSLLARNACHFAPYSWYRWEEFYLQARAFAEEAYHATGERKARLTNLAWIHHGYADHFLHDSFAAGHLINKTLVMQWYLDWAGNTWTPVPDWDLVQFMNVARQPNVAGQMLYSTFANPAARGNVRDPQTAHERWTLNERIAASGVVADGSPLGSSYKRWLAFLGNGVVQLASNSVHDHFNGSSLLVSSVAHPEAFQIWGDNTMIRGGDGYRIANQTAQLSQRSLRELLDTGASAVTSQEIITHFPTSVHDNPANLAASRSLQDWAYGLKDQAGGFFDGFKNRAVGSLRKRIEPVNIDKAGGWTWVQVLGKATDIAVGGDGWAWSVGEIGTDHNGPVQEWNSALTEWRTASAAGRGVRIAADGAGNVWVVNADGYTYRKAAGSQTWEVGERPHVGGQDGLLEIAAGTDGSVWGLAKAEVSGGHQLMRCIPGNLTHSWEEVPGGATSVSVGPDGLPWVVNSNGVLMKLVPGPGPGPDRYRAPAALWPDITPPGRKVTDIGVGVGPLLCAWVTTDEHIYAWNGRLPTKSGGHMPDWEFSGGDGVRIATGPDGRPWAVNADNYVFRVVPGAVPHGQQAVTEFKTDHAGRVTATAHAVDGALFQDEVVSINGSTDLRNVIVGNSRACVYGIWLTRSSIPGVYYTLNIDGQGPAGVGSGSMYVYIEDEGGFTEYKQFFARDHHTLTIDYNGTKAGIKRISWSDGNDPG
ncbi:MAG: eCIS core domain-containing protein [Acidimicrobiales bacterium]